MFFVQRAYTVSKTPKEAAMRLLLPCLFLLLTLTACAGRTALPKDVPPAKTDSVPRLRVWITETGTLAEMDAETYVAGVVAGEMRNDWPMEALKAQAILARTFVMKFLTEKTSRYPGADISTDIAEAQAYDAAAVNERILTAVQETSGLILITEDGTLPYTWFHAHSGGTTALAREALDWQGTEPSHTQVTVGEDSPAAPASARLWEAVFTPEEFMTACAKAGTPVSRCDDLRIGETGPSGRAVTLIADGTIINAARLRISLGSAVMRSTLLTELTVPEDGSIRMSGRGYGHGVGMPQWGAYALAESGMAAEDIALHYYNGLSIIKAW